MKIYLASRYSRFLEMQEYWDQLVRAGHVVTSRWINGDHQIDDRGLSMQAKEAERARFASEDRDDLLAADCVVSFTEAPRSSNSRGGRHVEHGMALALAKRTIIVGHRENVFHCLPEVEFFPNWQDAEAALSAAKRGEE
jgi:nucleoside 2-deoxyribosyltransferase